MQKFKTLARTRLAVFIAGAVLALLVTLPFVGSAKDKSDKLKDPDSHAQHKDKQTSGDQNLADQITELHAKVAKMEAILKQGETGTPSGTPDKGGLVSKQDKTGGDQPGSRASAKFQNCVQCHQTRPSGPLPVSHLEAVAKKDVGAKQDGMAAMGDKKTSEVGKDGMGMGMMGAKGMGIMGGKGMGKMEGKGMEMGDNKMPVGGKGMKDMDAKKGMNAMGGDKAEMSGMEGMDKMEMMGVMGMAPKSAGGMAGMKSMGKMQVQAALPGFPGASHIYHIGATDYFLNHPEHIDLTAKQQGDLGRVKEKAVLAKTSAQRKIDEAEQELWTLTSADQPDAAKIEYKIREIEKLRGDQRMALIRAVGGAAKLLTDEQRQALLGTGADKTAKPDPHAAHKP